MQPDMIEKLTWEAGARAKLVLGQQTPSRIAGRQIERIPVAHLTSKAKIVD